MTRVVQHCFGSPGKGGPATALSRFLETSAEDYAVIWQTKAAGGISISQIWSMARQVRRERPALVHVRGLGNEGFHGVLAAKLGGADKVLLSIHGTQRDLQSAGGGLRRMIVARVLEPLSLMLADRITTVCEFAARRPFLNRFRHKLAPAIPNGVILPDEDKQGLRQSTRDALEIGADELIFLAVSRLSIEKGYEDLAQASALVAARGITAHIVVVGDGPDQERIEKALRAVHGLKVHFVGHQNDVRPYLLAADVFVFPTWHENLSNALLEALAYGLPSIATDVGGNTEVINRGGGRLVPSRNPAALADAIAELAESASLRRQLSAQAVANVTAHYSLSKMVMAWESLYQRIIAGEKP